MEGSLIEDLLVVKVLIVWDFEFEFDIMRDIN